MATAKLFSHKECPSCKIKLEIRFTEDIPAVFEGSSIRRVVRTEREMCPLCETVYSARGYLVALENTGGVDGQTKK